MMTTNSSDTTRVIGSRQMPFLIVGVIGMVAWLALWARLGPILPVISFCI